MVSIISYVLKHENELDKSLFQPELFAELRSIYFAYRNGLEHENVDFSPEQKEAIISCFIENNEIFTETTPLFILENDKCIRASLERDFRSVFYLKNLFKKNPEIKKLVLEICRKQNYFLNIYTPHFLQHDYDFVLFSVTRNPESIRFTPKNLLYQHPDLFKIAVLNNILSDDDLKDAPLNCYRDSEISDFVLTKLKLNNHSDLEYQRNYNMVFHEVVVTVPTIESFHAIFDDLAENEWQEYKRSRLDKYSDILSKVCDILEKNRNYATAIKELEIFDFKTVLESRYSSLDKAMKTYHESFHSKQKASVKARNKIAELVDLYVSKFQETYKKECLHNYYSQIKEKLFIPRKYHPAVYKKLVFARKKARFKELYLKKLYIDDGNKPDYSEEERNEIDDVSWFINSTLNEYALMLKDCTDYSINEVLDFVKEMIDAFILSGVTKIEKLSFMAPNVEIFTNYKLGLTALKLLKKLELGKEIDEKKRLKYQRFFKSNESGYDFDNHLSPDEIKKCKEYLTIQEIFELIKRKINDRIETIEVLEIMPESELIEAGQNLKFSDEYFEFNLEKFKNFSLIEFINKFMSVCENFVNSDEIRIVITQNNLFWLDEILENFNFKKYIMKETKKKS